MPQDHDLATLNGLGEPASYRRLRRGETLFRRGDPASATFRLTSGRLRLERVTPGGTMVPIHTVWPGETFAEAALFADVYHCDAVALRASEVAIHRRVDVLVAIAADPAVGLALTARLARQVRDLRALVELRTVRPASERIVQHVALGLATRDRPLAAIAVELGLTPEAFYRALRGLERDRRIVRRGSQLELGKG